MSQAESFSIVVIGGMNPRLHHPLFYRVLGLINDEQKEAALKADSTVVMPQFSQLEFDGMKVQCLLDRWTVVTEKEENTGRLVEVADGVMTALEHTPVTGFGMNFDYLRPTAIAEVDARLGELVAQLPLGLPAGARAAATVSFVLKRTEHGANQKVTVHIAAVADRPQQVLIRNNYHYDVTLTDARFDLGEMLRERYARDHAEAKRQVESTLAAMGGV